jgi:hypothetical protein
LWDFILGAALIPFTFKCSSSLPKLIASLGMIFSILAVILYAEYFNNSDNAEVFGVILTIDIVCSIVIFTRMIMQNRRSKISEIPLNAASFIIAFVCLIIMVVVYVIGSLLN